MNNIKTKNKRSSSNNQFRRRNNAPKKGKAVSTIDPNKLINKAVVKEVVPFKAALPFSELAIDSRIKTNLAKKGYGNPTEIQEKSMEPLIDGRDMVGIASTGTGKTGAFLIPIIEQLLTRNKPFTSLVIVPTRELAQQVEEEFKSMTKGMNLYVSCFIGGTSVNMDLRKLSKNHHLIVGTPGRLLDLYDRRALKLDKIETLILDEFDRMLDMGFVNDIKKIIAQMKIRKQTMLFSATLEKSQQSIIDSIVNNPIEIKITSGTSASEQVEQSIIRVKEGEDKFKLLYDLIDDPSFDRVIVFAETKRLVDKLTKKLNQSGVTAGLIHGGKTQNFRSKAIHQFKKGNTKVLVATDVAARGIDIDNVSHVINYQLPLTMDSYVHRIGRTGRAGKTGMAYTFVE